MIVLYDRDKQRVPIKAWVSSDEHLTDGTIEQAMNMANLPFVRKWVSLMPDTHKGYGMPIGGVLATKNVIIPNAVGVDIGCGMGFVSTNIPAKEFKEAFIGDDPLPKAVAQELMRRIPTGFAQNSNPDPDAFKEEDYRAHKSYLKSDHSNDILLYLEDFSHSYGTLGGGNHFLEIQEGEDGFIHIMVHSGSRSFGAYIARKYNRIAIELNEKYYSSIPTKWELAFIPLEDRIGWEYIHWMRWALKFAKGNRAKMLNETMSVLHSKVGEALKFTPEFSEITDVHHNYADIENHYGENVWVHRKGAIRARKGHVGIVPGAMGSYSYIVEGLGNEESFHSAPHGAGRKMSRAQARRTFDKDEVLAKTSHFYLAKADKDDVAEEFADAYKNIDDVMLDAKDLLVPKLRLKTVAVLKG